MAEAGDKLTIAIVGGGFTGAAVALHLAAGVAGPGRLRIVVFEPRPQLGGGLAYSTHEPTHRINVPAGNMIMYPDDPTSFLRYAEDRITPANDPDARNAAGLLFPRRRVFGDYVAHEIEPHLASGAVEHRQAAVTGVARHGTGWRLESDGAESLQADIVVLAVSHPAPGLPRALAPLAGHAGLIAGDTGPDALAAVQAEDRVLVVGNGLTAADVIATLDRQGHRGLILSISRRGLRSRGHAPVVQEFEADFTSPPPATASQLLHRIRVSLREAQAHGIGWHAVLDAVRRQGQALWRLLPVAERRRIVRHVRPYWDVHRFRIAPQVEQVVERAIEEGRLDVIAASLRGVRADADGIHIALKSRRDGGAIEKTVDKVIVTTGPAHGGILESQSFLSRLRDAGYLTLCVTGLGLACDDQSYAIGADGLAVRDLLIAGPLARGTFGELMGMSQVSEHALDIARRIEALAATENAPADQGAQVSSAADGSTSGGAPASF